MQLLERRTCGPGRVEVALFHRLQERNRRSFARNQFNPLTEAIAQPLELHPQTVPVAPHGFQLLVTQLTHNGSIASAGLELYFS